MDQPDYRPALAPMIRITYDPVANAAYVYLKSVSKGEAVLTRSCHHDVKETMIMVDFNADGHIVGIDIMGARKLLSPETLEQAELPPPGYYDR